MLANSNEEPQQPAQQTQINNKSLTESEDDKSSNDNSFTASASYKGPYPIDQINNVRDYLVKEFINAPCRSKAELFLKLKLGIINDEIIDYFKYDKPHNPHLPDAFPEDEDDEADENPICIDEDYNSADEKEKVSKEDGLEEPDNKTNASQEELMKLSQTLKLEHGCESKFCPRDISFKDKYDPFDHINSVYICDVCFKMTGLKPSMEEHLKGENHFSASEYIVEGKKDEIYDPTISPMQSMSNSSIGTSSSETNLSLSNRKVAFLKKRSSLRNFNVNDSFIVFCPKPECSAFMSTNVLACALHYKYVHSVDKDVEIYSIGKFERLQEVEIEKKHSCPQCKLYHSKLLSLCEHLKNTDHFPRARKDEINVFVCPFDDCHFKSTIFFAFKTHLLSHKFFVSVGGEKITCKVRVYSTPKCFYHVPRFGEKSGLHEHIECERQCERKAIDDLVELHKNHSQFFEVNKQLKERKEQISSALMRTS